VLFELDGRRVLAFVCMKVEEAQRCKPLRQCYVKNTQHTGYILSRLKSIPLLMMFRFALSILVAEAGLALFRTSRTVTSHLKRPVG
jgi:hypothetical protein